MFANIHSVAHTKNLFASIYNLLIPSCFYSAKENHVHKNTA